MKIVMLGSGNMATFLALRLQQSGHSFIQVYSRELSRAESLAKQVDATAIDEISRVSMEADVYFLAVKDDYVTSLLQSLKNRKGLFIFLSGSLFMEELLAIHSPLGCLWCMYSIQKEKLPEHRNIPIFIQFDRPEIQDTLVQIAASLSDEITVVSDHQKRWLHLSAVFSNNFTNHLVAIAQELLKQHGLDEKLILPILNQTVSNLHEKSAKELQTGPAIRHDEGILKKHLELLSSTPAWEKVYQALSTSIADLYTKK